MAKYKSGEEAQVGDIVKCIAPVCEPYHPLCDDRTYKVTRTSYEVVCLEEHGDNTYREERFILVKRTGAEPPRPKQPMPEQPLVVWPEEDAPLNFDGLDIGELFVVDHDKQRPRVKVSEERYRCCVGGGNYSISRNVPVRRIQFNPANKEPVFEVI